MQLQKNYSWIMLMYMLQKLSPMAARRVEDWVICSLVHRHLNNHVHSQKLLERILSRKWLKHVFNNLCESCCCSLKFYLFISVLWTDQSESTSDVEKMVMTRICRAIQCDPLTDEKRKKIRPQLEFCQLTVSLSVNLSAKATCLQEGLTAKQNSLIDWLRTTAN